MAYNTRTQEEPKTVDGLTKKLNGLRDQLYMERSKRARERLPVWEADLECDAKNLNNEIRRLNGLPPDYGFKL